MVITVDAALEWPTGKVFLFAGDNYFRVDPATGRADPGYPRSITGNWPGLPSELDAAVLWNNGKAYFFKGDEYIRYDVAADRADDGYPKKIGDGWPGVFDSDIDAAILWNNGKAYFFKGSEYVRYDVAGDHADPGYPKSIGGSWPGLFESGLNDAAQWTNGQVLFLRGDRFVLYDIAADRAGESQAIPAAWFAAEPDSGGAQPSPSPSPAPAPVSDANALFDFQLQAGESINDRIVRCCEEALAGGPMGQHDRHDFYREFISCRQERTPAKAEALTGVRTSCAMFVRAVRQWCGAAPVGPYVPGTPMFKSMGDVTFAHPAFVPHDGTNTPNPGDYFYQSTTKQSNDGHTGIFIEETAAGTWRTAEGGGGDGTLCRFGERRFAGSTFHNTPKRLWGWFDCTKVGLPPSP